MSKQRKNRPNPLLKRPAPSRLSSSSISSTLIDVVIPVRGRLDLLDRCLDSIRGAFPDISYNIVLVDNASDEVLDRGQVTEFYARVSRAYPEVTIIRNKTNPGFPVSCNQGARRKNSPLLFFLNSDVILDPGSGSYLLNSLDDPEVGVVGMKLRFADAGDYSDIGLNPAIRPAGKLQHVGLSINVNGDVYHPYLGWDADHPRVNSVQEVFAVTGAALLIRRTTFMRAGGFYEGYGLGTFEDVDLCMIVREQGQKVRVNPSATAIHFTGATAEQLQMAYPLHQNVSLFRSRWADKMIWWDFFML